jgi:hypothetical protein
MCCILRRVIGSTICYSLNVDRINKLRKNSLILLNLIEKGIKNIFYNIFIIILFGVGIWLLTVGYHWVVDSVRPKAWTLFLYSSETPNTEEESSRVEGYANKTACLEKGIILSDKNGSFECGYDCRYRDEYHYELCEEICSKRGCRQ